MYFFYLGLAATGDVQFLFIWYLDAGRDMVASLQYGAKCACGYCHISDVESHVQEDHMESFFLAETVKYLLLLFDLAAGPDNLVENGPYKYIFSTEGHLLPATPEISLVNEHCSYLGAFCRANDARHRSLFNASDDASQEISGSKLHLSWGLTSFSSDHTFHGSGSRSGLIKGLCPGLTHGQKLGISYLAEPDITHKADQTNQQEVTLVRSNSVMVICNPKPKPPTEKIGPDDIHNPSPTSSKVTHLRQPKNEDDVLTCS
ncbi:hypothetical protein MKX01_015929 [Papaver californicum]|nr:hypothetical protein MKX01_015929 [Papaver californicum]